MALEKKEVGLVVAGVLSALFAVFLSTSPMAKHTHSPKSLVAPTAEQLQTSSYFQSNRSMWLHYRTAFPASMPPKAVVFVCHGFAEHTAREGYRRLSSALTNAGYAVFLLDHQGHGLSNGDKAYFEKFDHLVDDYVHFMRHVVHAFNSSIPLTTPKFLFGHSMGGAVSFLVSQRLSGEPASPVSLTGTVLSGPLFRLPNDDLVLQAFAHAASSLVPKLVVAHINATQVSRNATAVKNYVEDPLINRNVYARTAHNLFNATRHIAAHAGEVTWPFLIVHGDHDEMCLLEGSRAVHDQAKSTDKTLKTYPGMFHEPFEDELASAVLSDVVAWLNARVPA